MLYLRCPGGSYRFWSFQSVERGAHPDSKASLASENLRFSPRQLTQVGYGHFISSVVMTLLFHNNSIRGGRL